LGRPAQAYDDKEELIWQVEFDIYGRIREDTFNNKPFIPFRQLGQYEDVETGLYYNRFRYYHPESGLYLSQDPIKLEGNNPNFYAYVHDSNVWIDPFGLDVKRIYENAPYHGKVDNSVKSKAPTNGQIALDNFIQIKDTSPRRVGVDVSNNEIVVLDRTKINTDGSELYHGHVRSWDDLNIDMQNKLKKEGLVDKKGNIKRCK
jgi:RHS repeat-associated protein